MFKTFVVRKYLMEVLLRLLEGYTEVIERIINKYAIHTDIYSPYLLLKGRILCGQVFGAFLKET